MNRNNLLLLPALLVSAALFVPAASAQQGPTLAPALPRPVPPPPLRVDDAVPTSLNDRKIAALNIKGMTLQDFARLLSQGAGWKVVVSRDAAHYPVNVYFENIGGEDAIKAVCQSLNLWYRQDRHSGLITIMTLDEYRKGMLSSAQDTVRVVTVLYPDARTVGDTLQRLFRQRVIWNPPDEYVNDPIYDVERAVERMDYMADRVQATLPETDADRARSSSRSRSSSTGSSSSRRTSSRASTQARDQREQDRQKLADIFARDPEERLMARLSGAMDQTGEPGGVVERFVERFGEPGIVYISAFQGTNDLLLRSSDPDAVEEIAEVIKRLDRPKPQVLLEVKVLDLVLDDSSSFGIDWLFKSGKWSGGRSPGAIQETDYGKGFATIAEPGGSSSNLFPVNGSGLDAKSTFLQFVSNDLAARVQAMQEAGRVIAIATPNLCVADGEASRIFIGKTTTVLTSVEVQSYTVGDDRPMIENTVSPETERMNIGTTLLITPRIHADRTTTIRIVQEASELGEYSTINYGSNLSFDSQDVDMRTVTTTVVAADGKLSAIGGLIREEVDNKEVGLPGVMNIPYIGSAFKTSLKKTQRRELLILIRPFILLGPEETEPVTREFLARLSEHPSAHCKIPPLRIGEGSFTVVNEKMYPIPKDAMRAVKSQARAWSTEDAEE